MAGNQLTFLKAIRWKFPDKYYQFEGEVLPAFHFGILLDQIDWSEMRALCLAEDLCDEKSMTFLEGKPGHHSSFFIEDPNEYVIEFKTFQKEEETFSI